jgi:hypothetical protein
MGPYARLVEPYLDVGSPYRSSPSDGVVLSALRGAGMASVWFEGIAVPSVLLK